MQMPIEETAGGATTLSVGGGSKASARPWGSFLERIADGTYMADAHALAQSFLEYLEHLAGPA
jgi:hypothetical protein